MWLRAINSCRHVCHTMYLTFNTHAINLAERPNLRSASAYSFISSKGTVGFHGASSKAYSAAVTRCFAASDARRLSHTIIPADPIHMQIASSGPIIKMTCAERPAGPRQNSARPLLAGPLMAHQSQSG